MNFFSAFLQRSSPVDAAPPPTYPGGSAQPQPQSRANGRAGDEEQWDVDAEEKRTSVAAGRQKGGVASGAPRQNVSAEQEQQRLGKEAVQAVERARAAAEAARRNSADEERKVQEEEARLLHEKEACDLVHLAMYDLSGGLAKYVPAAFLSGNKFEGVWHTGCRAFGKEFWFGGGVFENEFDESPFGIPVRIVRLGTTRRTYEELMEFIRDEMIAAYNPHTYHFLSRNCNHFTNEIVKFLMAGRQAKGAMEEVLEQPKSVTNHPLAQLLIPAMNKWLGGFGADEVVLGRTPQVRHMTRAEKEREQKRVTAQWSEWVQERNRQREIEQEERRREDEQDEFQNFMLECHQKMEDEERQAVRRAEEEKVMAVRRAEEAKKLEEKRQKERNLQELIRAQERYEAEEKRKREQHEAVQRSMRETEERRSRAQQDSSSRARGQQDAGVTERRREAEQTLRDVLSATKQGGDKAVLQWALQEAKEAGLASSAPQLIRDAESALNSGYRR